MANAAVQAAAPAPAELSPAALEEEKEAVKEAVEEAEEEEEKEKPAPFNADLDNGGARSYGMQKVKDNGYGGTKDWSTIAQVHGGKVKIVQNAD